MQVIKKLLNKKYDNHLFPFLWLHGESEKVIKEYIKKINETGIGAVCIESRPHPNYLQDKWWEDVEIVLKECKKRNMKVWFFDDQHFPTGYAGGALENGENKELTKLFLAESQLDFVGPQDGSSIMINWAAGNRPHIMSVGKESDVDINDIDTKNKIVAVLAAPQKGYRQIDEGKIINLANQVKDGVLYWDIPKGDWTIIILYTTHDGGEQATKGYLNPLLAKATDLLLKNVYQKHYDHFASEFGKTIAGFFSDEPRFGNIKGPNAQIGKVNMALPWIDGMEKMIEDRLDNESSLNVIDNLPLLFSGSSPKAHEIQYLYMDLVSRLYSNNFSMRIGKWCRKHNVKYIGHVIEDNNAHARLGYGAGHFFRSMAGQDMAGIDVVLHQLLPEHNNGYFNSMTSTGWDGEFFHYDLAEMGTSLGRLDPSKHGNTMCEIFGAFGWSEDITFMKWLADHMLVRGVNYFVPHAFSLKEYPDPDCPPHFYAHGNNPQYVGMKPLVSYMNRVSNIFSNGTHVCNTAVLYHGEAEWSGKRMLDQKVTRKLVENQIGFEIVPSEYIENLNSVQKGKFSINSISFSTLIIPFSERLPKKLIERICQLNDKGVKIVFINELPSGISDDLNNEALIEKLNLSFSPINLDDIISYLKGRDAISLRQKNRTPWLRYYCYKHSDGLVYMFFNENTKKSIKTYISINGKNLKIYDPINNSVMDAEIENNDIFLNLEPAESCIIFESKVKDDSKNIICSKSTENISDNNWKIKFDGKGLLHGTSDYLDTEGLPILGLGDKYSDFAGKITYSTDIFISKQKYLLRLEGCRGIIAVYLNNQYVGTKIGTPYSFDLSPYLVEGKNKLNITWISSLGRYQRDYLSQYMLLGALEITNGIVLEHYDFRK